MRRPVGISLVLAAGLAFTACGAPAPRMLPPPSSTSSTEAEPTTTRPDYSRIALQPLPGETTTTAPLTEGSATLRGAVVGPDGPVPNAVVRADRLVGDAVQRTEVRTAADGTYEMAGIPGGRFRVRAFLPPTLIMNSAEVFFLENDAERELRLVVESFTGRTVSAATTPVSPIAGQAVNLAVRVAQRTVGEDGIAREVPSPGVAVRVSATGWTAVGAGRDDDEDRDEEDRDEEDRDDDDTDETPAGRLVRTDANGVAVFSFRCTRATTVTVTATVGDDAETVPVDVPPCRPVPTTTTTSTTATSTTAPADADDDSSTSTTEP